ncbi:stage II sporulation protein P [Metabacillus sp. JX24]|uniref:stage II sporulation protein P n=1 Tax=Metabacillus sp. JX24 TaxID=3240759 RepID=UPI003510A84B
MSPKNPTTLFISGTLVTVFATFLLISIIVNLNIKYQSEHIQKVLEGINSEDLFTHFLRAENHYFYQPDQNENDLFSLGNISKITFQLLTNVVPEDARTYLGRELPGLSLYDTEIAIAGEGTTMATLPEESSPPLEVLLKERELVEENLKNSNDIFIPNDNKAPKDKKVFVYQTHSWESFLPLLKNAKVPNDAISNDKRANVIALGARLSNNLIQQGIGVSHDQTNMTEELNDRKWSDTKSYGLSGEIIQASAASNQNLEYYIDIHRDSVRRPKTTKTIKGKNYARLFFVIGKGNPNYQQNQQFAEKLHNDIESKYPGLSRGVFLKPKSTGNGVYNQTVSNRAILLEVGGVDNTLEELQRSIDVFSEVFGDNYWQEQKANEVIGDGK